MKNQTLQNTSVVIQSTRIMLVVLFTILGGCYSTGPLYEEDSHRKNETAGDYSITIKDKRPDTTASKLSPSVDKHELITIFHHLIENHRVSDLSDYSFELDLIEGYKLLMPDEPQKEDHVVWKVTLRSIAMDNPTHIMQSNGDCWGEISSMDNMNAELDDMFIHCYESAVSNALTKLNLGAIQ
ncbi:hypothetical protein [Solemya velum gill symbiont]|uniref:hypothetical protein n=1 Tax=Solemya velum gill symbiont TaxID=2340 RepID=UPI0009962EDC|nr:hypothetical protein [Solemya velum gill symbiont]OOY97889.1 hypothetical protein BOW19_10315 [Solemya velum gill symbiont]OOY99870.1 hypothetical protein BOW20_10315 [Solemya velum gill symbiont]OOZ02246.1 hypothetical protein BOW21_10395 [Solemya velum gill symbiont]OOZ04238.1 hypothetical protein BOW22_10310 [Solemya velum gill symbiont]OOZ06480.1 hypothetical protein BOW23_10315 [Solemya velum gill symbiont]